MTDWNSAWKARIVFTCLFGQIRVHLLKSINANITEMGTLIHISAFNNADSSSYISFPQSFQNHLFGIRFFLVTTIIMFANSESIGNHCCFWKAFNQAKMWDIHHKWVLSYYNKFYLATQAVILPSISHS